MTCTRKTADIYLVTVCPFKPALWFGRSKVTGLQSTAFGTGDFLWINSCGGTRESSFLRRYVNTRYWLAQHYPAILEWPDAKVSGGATWRRGSGGRIPYSSERRGNNLPSQMKQYKELDWSKCCRIAWDTENNGACSMLDLLVVEA